MDNLAADFEINPNNPLNAEYELGEGVGFDCSFELFASGTVWGSIDGDINNQTDLINLLNTKVDLTSFEELSQTVTNNYNELTGDIADLTTTVTDNYNTLSGQISDLTTTVNDNYTSLDNRLTTAEGSILNLTDTVNDNYTELNGKITATNNNLSTLSQTVQDNNTAINNRVDGIVESFDGDISDLNNAIDNLSDTVSDNYTDLNGKITDNTDDITTIQNTINSYGDIVSYNAAYFATANQGALADTALQPNDNISELVNDVGYITSASLPTVNNATITIQKNGSNVGTFTLNQANNDTLNITVPTQASDIGAMPDTTTIEDLTTTAQLNALNSGATTTNIGQITTNQNNIADIRSLIPLQASTSNQLADKGFVNSSIATNTANFIGTFNSVAELEAYSGTLTNNDYAFVATTDSAGNTLYDRYKYNADTQEWLFEYELNNSSFTAQQWASINSGITSGDVTLIGTALQPNDNISELINDAGYITSASLPTVNNGTLDIQVNGTSVGTFTANQSGNTTANIVVPDSATWGNITGTLSDQTDLQTALDSKYDASNPNGYITSSDLPTVDQTFDGTSANAQSGVAISGAGFLQNTATGTNSITILGTPTFASSAINIGVGSSTTIGSSVVIGNNAQNTAGNSVAIGESAKTMAYSSIAIGSAAVAQQSWAYQIGRGANNTANSLKIGFGSSNNYQLLDGTTGLIPDERISSNIARTSQIPTVPTNISAFTNDSGYITSSALNGYATETWVGNQGYITGITSSDVTTALGYTPYNSTNPSGYITSSDLPTNYVTTDTVQNISGRKTFLGEKAIYFKQTATTDKLGFTLYNPSNTELGALEWRPNTINGNALLALNCPQSGSNYVGFRYWSNINIVAPRPTTDGNYFIPVNITDGTNTVTANNNGTLNISTLLPIVNNGTLTIQKNGTTVGTFTANDTNNVTANISVPTSISNLTDDTATTPIDKAESVVDNNSGSLTFWSGTKAEYDAIATKYANTLYNIEGGGLYKGTTLISNDGADTTLSNVSSIDSNSAVQTALDGKVDTSLSNLSATGKTVIDGQWVAHYQEAIGSTAQTINSGATKNITFTDLPAKNCEVMFTIAQSTNYELGIYSNLIGSIANRALRQGCICMILPVSSNKTIKIQNLGSGTASINLVRMAGYRVLGTNTNA